MTLFGQRILSDLTKLSTLKIAHPGLPRYNLNPVANALTKDGREKTGLKRADLVKTKAEMLGDQDLLEQPETERDKEGLTLDTLGGSVVLGETSSLTSGLWDNERSTFL